MSEILTQICSKCKSEKSVSEFSRYARSKTGRFHQCKSCVREYQNSIRDKLSVYHKEYRKAHPEYFAKRCAKYYAEHRDTILERNKQWLEDNKEKRKEYIKGYTEKNKDKINTRKRELYRKNKLKNH